MAIAQPVITVTAGVTRISIFVSLDTSLPTSQAIVAQKNTASGPPGAFPSRSLPGRLQPEKREPTAEPATTGR